MHRSTPLILKLKRIYPFDEAIDIHIKVIGELSHFVKADVTAFVSKVIRSVRSIPGKLFVDSQS